MPDIGVSYLQGLEDLGPVDDFISRISAPELRVEVKERKSTAYASLEWLVPTAVVVFIGRAYFDGFLREMGKNHCHLLKDGMKALGRRLLGPSGPKFQRVTTSGKVSDGGKYSLVYSVQAETASQRQVKLLVRNGVSDDELSESIDAFLELFLSEQKTLEAIMNDHARLIPKVSETVLLSFSYETKSIELVNPVPIRQEALPVTSESTVKGIVDQLEDDLSAARQWLRKGNVNRNHVTAWSTRAHLKLRQIVGPSTVLIDYFPNVTEGRSDSEYAAILTRRVEDTARFLDGVRKSLTEAYACPKGKVFFGHGHSQVWRVFKDFVAELGLQWDEYNRETPAGLTVQERLDTMLSNASFAFLVMTAEDEYADKTLHARSNVIHEVGLFQGRLGPRRAIVLLEEGCQSFSNIHGLNYISFHQKYLQAAFDGMRKVMEREGIFGR